MKFKLYKNSLYFGNKRLFKFTKEHTKKVLHKFVWFTLLLILFLTMIFGGVALILGNTTQQVVNPYNNQIELK